MKHAPPYFYLKAGPGAKEITRQFRGGSISLCIPTSDSGWVDFTLSLVERPAQGEVVITYSTRTNKQDRETILLQDVVVR